MTHEDEITALRAENARLREQLSESHCAARVTEMQKRCTRAEAAERLASAAVDYWNANPMDGIAASKRFVGFVAEYVAARDAAGGT